MCNYCQGEGGAIRGMSCPVCGVVSVRDAVDDHLTAPCTFCQGNHAVVFCAKYNTHTGMEPLHGYQV